MNSFTKNLEQLALKQEINRQLDAIIKRANEIVVLLKPSGNKESELEENQIRNVINVASSSQNVEVVTNFIRYQIGRSKSGKQWQYGNFGEKIIEDIESGIILKSAQSAANKSVQEIEKRSKTAIDKESLLALAYIKLTLLYLGYLNWAFYYCKKGDGWDKLIRKEDKNVP